MRASQWTTLGDITIFINGGAWNQSEYSDSGIPVVRVSDIHGETIDLSGCKYLPEESFSKYAKHELQTGDLIICTVGSHPTQPRSVVGRPGIVPARAKRALLNQNTVLLRPSSSKVDKGYLGFLGRSEGFHEYIKAHARGAANQVRMAIGSLKEMPVHLPDVPTQLKIAGILSAYDDLIENNLRRIRILEEMAQSLYREWFVHFRFPGHEGVRMVDSALGLIPEGWEVKKLGDIAQDVRRGIPKGHLDEPTPYVGLEHIPRQSLALDNWVLVSELGSNKLIFEPGEKRGIDG